MKALITVTKVDMNGALINAVSARELYLGLGLDVTHWVRWSSLNIELNGFFLQGVDFIQLASKATPDSPNPPKDYAISIDMGKHLAMMAKTEKAHDYRNYFITLETKQPKLTELQLISKIALEMDAANKLAQEHEHRIEALEAKQSAITEGFSYFSILAFSNLNNINIDLSTAAALGKRAAQLSRELNVPIDKIRDPRFGQVNAYKEAILKTVFAEALAGVT